MTRTHVNYRTRRILLLLAILVPMLEMIPKALVVCNRSLATETKESPQTAFLKTATKKNIRTTRSTVDVGAAPSGKIADF
jgi:hypothetical protein